MASFKFISTILNKQRSIASLVSFRILFGLILFVASIRFWLNGWIDKLYLEPTFFFKYFGFEWVEVLPEPWLKLAFALTTLAALCIAIGFHYRKALIVFIVGFCYFELLDATHYLNHHYLVVLFALILLALPANQAFSLDVRLKRVNHRAQVPQWTILALCLQIGIVYTFAGIAKLNPDWLFRAMPLAIWLPERSGIPIIGPLLTLPITAFIFSWFGALYDCTISFFLAIRKTRIFAYSTVVVFHVLTAIFFNIGIFPILMICSNLVFFSDRFHLKIYDTIGVNLRNYNHKSTLSFSKPLQVTFGLFLVFQAIFPLRHLLYSSNTMISEEGYQFSWRVMLVEKSGVAKFTIHDQLSERWFEVDNQKFLTKFQEKQMAIKPEFMIQYAHYLKTYYTNEIADPIVKVQAFVTLNGRTSQQLVKPDINLLSVNDGLEAKTWLLANTVN